MSIPGLSDAGVDVFLDVKDKARSVLAAAVAEPVQLNEAACRAWLGDLVPFGPAVRAGDAEAAVVAATETGYPVVCKLLAPSVLHKTEAGLVRTGLTDSEALAKAAAELLGKADALALPEAALSVQRQLSGVEVAIGVYRDALGPVVMVAAGGAMIELLADVTHEMAPVTRAQALAMIESLKVGALLRGYRGGEAADVEALADLIVRVGELALAVPEIAELDLNPVFVSALGVHAADARATLRVPAAPARDGLYPELAGFATANRIAVIGGSGARLKVGGLLPRYLRKHGFAGDLIVVNSHGAEVPGATVVKSLAEVGEPIDLACIAVPRSAVRDVVRDCIEAGIPRGVIFSAGFAEAGEAGQRAQDELVTLAEGKFRFVGPNSMGVAALHHDVMATFGMALEADSFARGAVAFLSQSGSIASSLFSRAAELGVEFSHWISVGNEGDLGIEDFIAYAADDPHCRVICLFLEVIRRPGAFARATAKARAAGKPVIAYKTGWTDSGRLATASHTGALASTDAVYSAFLRRHGVLRVDDFDDLFTVATAVESIGGVAGRRIGIVSMSGGACSILVDCCESRGLQVPVFAGGLRARLEELLPSYASARNPVDVTATGIQQPDLVPEAARLIAESGAVDLILVQLGTNADPSAAVMAKKLLELRKTSPVPFLVGRLGGRHLAPAAVEIYAAGKIPVYSWPAQLVVAAAAATTFGSATASGTLTHLLEEPADAVS